MVSIAILAGGRSTRLGEDKALLRLIESGPTLLERAAAACAGLSDDLFVVAPAERGYASLGVRLVDERFPGEGPAGGVITALGTARYPHCLVIGCDYPLLARPLLRWLIEQADPDRPVLPEMPAAGRQGRRTLEVLHGAYPTAALPAIEWAFTNGERQLARIIRRLHPRLLAPEELLRFDPGLRSFRSVNRRADAEWARGALLAQAGPPDVRRGSRGDDILSRCQWPDAAARGSERGA